MSDALKNSFENSFKIAIVLTLFNCYNWYLKIRSKNSMVGILIRICLYVCIYLIVRFVFNDGEPWKKKDNDNGFGVTMGSLDGAETCELVQQTYGKYRYYNKHTANP
jgi:hypothetical protein